MQENFDTLRPHMPGQLVFEFSFYCNKYCNMFKNGISTMRCFRHPVDKKRFLLIVPCKNTSILYCKCHFSPYN